MFALWVRSEPVRLTSTRDASLVFVCQNGVAMSLWSALMFNRMAAAYGLSTRATSRAAAATFTGVPPQMTFALLTDGFRLDGYKPQVVDAGDVARTLRVILIDTQLPPAVSASEARVERWGGFPPMREQYFASRAALQVKLNALVASIAAEERAWGGVIR